MLRQGKAASVRMLVDSCCSGRERMAAPGADRTAMSRRLCPMQTAPYHTRNAPIRGIAFQRAASAPGRSRPLEPLDMLDQSIRGLAQRLQLVDRQVLEPLEVQFDGFDDALSRPL
jgi:hypothetical protein